MKIKFNLLLLVLFLNFASKSNRKKKLLASEITPVDPVGVTFNIETLKRLGSRGDNWCLTWTADGSQMVTMCDGN